MILELRRLKHFCSITSEYGINVSAENYTSDGVRLIRTTDVTEDGTLTDDAAVFIDPQAAASQLVAPGDLLFSRSGTVGRCLLYSGPPNTCTFAAYLVRFRARPEVDPRYIGYCSKSTAFTKQVRGDSTESTISNFNAEKYGNVTLPWWGPETQRAIADFLDVETARIDSLIDKKQRMIELVIERRRQLLGSAMMSMGVRLPPTLDPEWSTEPLPPGWQVMHLNQCLLQLTNGFVGPTRDILEEEGIRYVQSLHIKNGEIDFDRRPFYVSEVWHRERPRIHLRPEDVLIVQTGDIGQVAVVPDGFGEASCHALQIARVRPEVVSGTFLAEFLRTPFGYESLLKRATGALHPHLEGGVRDVPVILPPRAVQDVLVREVQRGTRTLGELEGAINAQLQLLAERRQALITAAVTGELEVPGVAA